MSYRCNGPWWRELLYVLAPFLFWTCPRGGNRHWTWSRRCSCPSQDGELSEDVAEHVRRGGIVTSDGDQV